VFIGPFERDVQFEEIVDRAYDISISRDEHPMISENA
jgi:hypothetical protein